MRAMILAAGRGERLRPLTDSCPKPLLEVGDKPLIAWHLDNLRRAGITDIIINTAWLGHMIHEQLGDGSRYGVSIRYSDEGEALETAGGIIHALPLLGKSPFLVINGDTWCDIDLASLVNRPLQAEGHVVLVENPEHNAEGDFGIEHGKLVNRAGDMYTFSGTGVYSPVLFEGIGPGKAPLAPILRDKAEQGLVSAEVHRGRWTDVGTIERLGQLRSEL